MQGIEPAMRGIFDSLSPAARALLPPTTLQDSSSPPKWMIGTALSVIPGKTGMGGGPRDSTTRLTGPAEVSTTSSVIDLHWEIPSRARTSLDHYLDDTFTDDESWAQRVMRWRDGGS